MTPPEEYVCDRFKRDVPYNRQMQCSTCKWGNVRKRFRTKVSDEQAPCEYDPFSLCLQSETKRKTMAQFNNTVFYNTMSTMSYALWEPKPELYRKLDFIEEEEFAV